MNKIELPEFCCPGNITRMFFSSPNLSLIERNVDMYSNTLGMPNK